MGTPDISSQFLKFHLEIPLAFVTFFHRSITLIILLCQAYYLAKYIFAFSTDYNYFSFLSSTRSNQLRNV